MKREEKLGGPSVVVVDPTTHRICIRQKANLNFCFFCFSNFIIFKYSPDLLFI
jgi:hypothetical protein